MGPSQTGQMHGGWGLPLIRAPALPPQRGKLPLVCFIDEDLGPTSGPQGPCPTWDHRILRG